MAPRADHAGRDRGDDEDRLEALAEDDQGGVRDHGDVARAVTGGPARLLEGLVEDESRLADFARRRFVVAISSASPGVSFAPNQM